MTTALITDKSLAVRFSLREKVAGLITDIDVPLTAVRSASVEPDGLRAATGIRAPGLALPRHTKIGTWRRQGRRTVVVARRGRPALRVDLSGHRYSSLLLDVESAAELASALTASVESRRGVTRP